MGLIQVRHDEMIKEARVLDDLAPRGLVAPWSDTLGLWPAISPGG
jgi:hypothetical protein